MIKASFSADSPAPGSTPVVQDIHEAIRRRAEEIYIRNGRTPGHDLENWAQAEREIRAEAELRGPRTAVVVSVNGVRYVGEYRPELSGGYVPGEISAGGKVLVRLDGDRMFIARPNGKQLETRIVQKIGEE